MPNKRRAFREIRRVLKPGTGRFAISCTTLRHGYGHINKFMTDEAAQAQAAFPSCMEVFMPLDAAVPMLASLGFEDVHVDESNAAMSVWDDVEREMQSEVDAALARDMGMLPEGGAGVARREEEADAAWIESAVAEVRESSGGGDGGGDSAGGGGGAARQGEATAANEEHNGDAVFGTKAAAAAAVGGGTEEAKRVAVESPPTVPDGGGQVCPAAASFDGADSLEQERLQMDGFHSNAPRYKHLSSLSMDDICARVVLYGVRPADEQV